MNAGNILKPALSRGEIQVIGATTFTEYRKYIEKDQALERRFQPVRVEEPSVADTLAVMNGIKRYYEQHHHVQVPAEVLSAVVTLSERYITDRFLPDKAIDLLDEACACCNLAHPVISEYLGMQKELDALKQEEAEMESADVNEAIDYERVAERKTRIAKLESELPAKQAAASEIQVTMDDVAKVIELWTGIPAVKIRETEFAKLAGLENALKQKVIGQDEAVHLVAQAIKRSRADLSGRRRPASFIFVGPTGVGKTELVKQPVRIDLVFALCCKFGVDGGIGRQSRLQALLRQFRQRERRSPQSFCAGLQSRQFEHLPHTAVHPLRLLLNDTQIVCLLFRCKVITEQLGGGAEHGERRFQLVCEARRSFAAYPLYALLFAPDAQLRTGQHCRAE